MEQRRDWLDIITLLIVIITAVIPLVTISQTSPDKIATNTYIIFGIIVLVLLIGSFIIYIISKWNKMNKDIEGTKKEVEEIKRDLNFKVLWNMMDVRIKVLEKLFDRKNKKGQMIDPRIIFWIILLILLYLFLKSSGFFQ
ncbi:MAG: hypothetical protein AABW80_05080 [Nanoarchaeota archaeon]